jgi:GNAT superfamily N-acetyltransferase
LLIERGAAHGVIGFAGEKPAGWCAFDRKAMIPGHDCVGDSLSGHETEQWVIHCFYTLPDYRGHGLARFMLAHALAYLSDQGAGSVEAYPTPLRDDGRCFLFAGTYSMYQSFGFEHAGDIDERYCRMRKQLP